MGELASGAFNKVTARFDDQMSGALSEKQLATTWTAGLAEYGKFNGVSGVKVGRKPPLASAVVACRFTKGHLEVLVNVDSAGRVSGLWLRPATVDIESVSRAIVSDLAAGAFNKVTARFNAELSRALSDRQLATAWAGLAKFGPFNTVAHAAIDQLSVTAVLTCRFAKGTVEIRIILDWTKRVRGLWFKPVAAEP